MRRKRLRNHEKTDRRASGARARRRASLRRGGRGDGPRLGGRGTRFGGLDGARQAVPDAVLLLVGRGREGRSLAGSPRDMVGRPRRRDAVATDPLGARRQQGPGRIEGQVPGGPRGPRDQRSGGPSVVRRVDLAHEFQDRRGSVVVGVADRAEGLLQARDRRVVGDRHLRRQGAEDQGERGGPPGAVRRAARGLGAAFVRGRAELPVAPDAPEASPGRREQPGAPALDARAAPVAIRLGPQGPARAEPGEVHDGADAFVDPSLAREPGADDEPAGDPRRPRSGESREDARRQAHAETRHVRARRDSGEPAPAQAGHLRRRTQPRRPDGAEEGRRKGPSAEVQPSRRDRLGIVRLDGRALFLRRRDLQRRPRDFAADLPRRRDPE